MPHKSVECIDPPFRDNDDGRVAYCMVYTALNDKLVTVAFDKLGKEIGKKDGDIREDKDISVEEGPSVAWVKPLGGKAEPSGHAPKHPTAPTHR